jgi:hypothetical protein
MAVCDICSKTMSKGEGYTLTTKQVVTVPAYWTRAFMGAAGAVSIMPAEMVQQVFEQQLRQQCGQTTGWLTCEDCIAKFPEVDRDQARAYAQEFWSKGDGNHSPPGGGAVDPSLAIAAANQAWKQATGTPAPTTKYGGGGDCFIATACYGSPDCPEVLSLRRWRDERLAPRAWGRVFIEWYYRLSPPVAAVLRRSAPLRVAVRRLFVSPLARWAGKGNRR